jgi:hypothetical protein
VVINYSPKVTVNAPSGDAAVVRRAVMDALRADRDELLNIVDGARATRLRREFD